MPTGPALPLLLVAHGSSDPRFANVIEAIAASVRSRRTSLDVRIGYLEHGPPHVCDGDVVAVPLLLSAGYHALTDLPQQAPTARVTRPIGPDPRLADALADRLAETSWDRTTPVVLAAAGSNDPGAIADARAAAGQLSRRLGVDVTAAFLSTGEPQLAQGNARVVASYLLAPGAFHQLAGRCGATVVTEPIGAHPAIADIVLDRYDEACQGLGRK